MNRDNGFTIVELMVALVVLGILVTVALPSFSDLIRNNKISGQANDFIGGLSLARSEAIRRGSTVCVKSKSATAGSWTPGWRVFEEKSGETNCATVPDTSSATDKLRLIQDYDALSGGNTLNVDDPFKSYIRFNGMGVAVDSSGAPQRTQDTYTTAAPDKAFKLCRSDGNTANSRLIGVSVTGRPYRVSNSSGVAVAPSSCP